MSTISTRRASQASRPYEAGALQRISRRPAEPANLDEALPDARLVAQQLSVAVVDVVEGRRDARSIQRWMTPEVYRSLLSMVLARRGRGGSLPALAMTTRAFRVNADTIEFATTVWDQSRARAVAGRLIRLRKRWLIVALESPRPAEPPCPGR